MPSQTFVDAALAQETGEVFLVLLTISHPDLAQLGLDYPDLGVTDGVLRFVSNSEDIVSRTKTFKAYGFEFTPPGQGQGERAIANLAIDNIDRRLALVIRQLTTKPKVLVEVVLASDPDVVERELPEFELAAAGWDMLEIQGELAVEQSDEEPVCSYTFSPKWAPALF